MKYQNANMYQKSLIQQQLEYNAIVENFKHTLSNILEKYNVQDNVFGIVKNGNQYIPSEINSGYFVKESECEDLQSAIREMTSLDKCIRIIESAKFQVGTVHRYLTECAADTLYDIENQTEIVC